MNFFFLNRDVRRRIDTVFDVRQLMTLTNKTRETINIKLLANQILNYIFIRIITNYVFTCKLYKTLNCRSFGFVYSHVPEWERHPHGTFVPPLGCTFSQNLQCQLETICPTEVEKSGTIPVSKTTEKTMTTTETHKRQFEKTVENPVKVETTTADYKVTTTEQEEITQHIFIHVPKYVTETTHSGATVISVNSFVTILSVVMNIFFFSMKLCE